MMTNNERYNAERKAQSDLIKRDVERDKVLKELYQVSYNRMQSQINGFYMRYADKEGLSHAEAMKRASELHKRSTGKSLYILDEPTTGLHTEDISRLLRVLDRFVDDGNTVLVIEHNLDVIKTADHIIDLGPEGGVGGGTIIATGTPEEVAANPTSYTGQYLKEKLHQK